MRTAPVLVMLLLIGPVEADDAPKKTPEEAKADAMFERRTAALRNAGISTDDHAALIRSLSSDVYGIRSDALFVLNLRKVKEAVPAIRSLLRDETTTLRLNACDALGSLGDDPKMWKPVCKALVEGDDALIALRAAGLLVKHAGDASGWPVVQAALVGKDSALSAEAASVATTFDGLTINSDYKIDVVTSIREVFGRADANAQLAMLPAICGSITPANKDGIKALEAQSKSPYIRNMIHTAVEKFETDKAERLEKP